MGSDWEAAEDAARMNEQENETERDDGPEARAAAALLNAFGDLFHTGGMVELTDSALRTIGNSYGSASFYYGLERPKALNKLLKAMTDYAVLVPAADPLLFPESPLGEGPTDDERDRMNRAHDEWMKAQRGGRR